MTDYTLDGTPPIKLTVYGSEEGEPTALHLHYEGQCNNQPIDINITPAEEVIDIHIAPDPNIGGVPEEIWNGRVLQISRREMLTCGEARAFVEQNAETIREICAEHSIEWDGNNMVGKVSSERVMELYWKLSHEFEKLESAFSYSNAECPLGPDGLDDSDIKRLEAGEIMAADLIEEIRAEMRSQGIVCTADDGELEKAIQEDLEHYRERKAEDMEQSTV